MLDTNTARYIIKGNVPDVRKNLLTIPMEQVCISVITQAELLFGVARRPDAKGLHIAVNEFLLRLDILPWNSSAAERYAALRAECERKGKILGSMDMMIAAHAISSNATLVTNDQAFHSIKTYLKLADWTKPKWKPVKEQT
jgi:tRNA(fMet)-specific endonuclease VapC